MKGFTIVKAIFLEHGDNNGRVILAHDEITMGQGP
jgi:hypothetical protein